MGIAEVDVLALELTDELELLPVLVPEDVVVDVPEDVVDVLVVVVVEADVEVEVVVVVARAARKLTFTADAIVDATIMTRASCLNMVVRKMLNRSSAKYDEKRW